MNHRVKLLFLFFLFSLNLFSQQSNSTFSRNFNIFSEKEFNFIDSDNHTVIKPYLLSNLDSILTEDSGNWLYKKWKKEQ